MKPLSLAALLLAALALWLYTPDLPRARLAARYGADRTIEVEGLGLRVADQGPPAAPVLVLLHGFGASLDTWNGWAAALAPRYRVIRFDLPGFGLTGADPTGDYSDARTLALLQGVLDRLGVARATLIGNSLGGRIAWKFAAAHPDRITRLVLISPDGFAGPGDRYGATPRISPFMRLLPYVLPRFLVRASLAPAYADPRRMTQAIVTRYRDLMRAPGVRRAMLSRAAQTVLTDPRPDLARITAPVLLLWGVRDRMIPIGNSQDYLRALPHARLVPLPDLGHVPFEEDPSASLQPVLAFLDRG